MQRPGGGLGQGPQGLRAMPNNVFTSNANATTNRGTPLGGAGRLQNGAKLGSNNWGFGGMMGVNAQSQGGLPQAQRVNSGGAAGASAAGGLASFAQTIGGGSNQPPIDLSRKKRAGQRRKHYLDLGAEEEDYYDTESEAGAGFDHRSNAFGGRGGVPLAGNSNTQYDFPSLSGGAPQQQNQQYAQAQSLWSNASIRQNQQTPIQRGQGQSSQQQAQQQQQQEEQAFGQANGDDYGGFGGLSVLTQAPSNTVDDFPPLGGLGSTEGGQDQRTGLLQNAAFGGGVGQGTRYGALGQSRLGLTSPDGQQPTGMSLQGSSRLASGESNGLQRPAPGFEHSQQQQQQPIGSNGDFQRPNPDIDIANVASQQISAQPNRKRLADMSELDRWSLPGLLAMIPTDSPDHSTLAVGQDLTVLGLDLNRPDNSPLYPTFGTPFAPRSSQTTDPLAPPKPVAPDFAKAQLPPSYGVTNVPPLQSKMTNFQEDTLFAIFYGWTRDIMQEYAGQELYRRDWRWHKRLRQWMMKDPGYAGQPAVQIDGKSERGVYLFFDVATWKREKRELILVYEDLDQRHGGSAEMQNQGAL